MYSSSYRDQVSVLEAAYAQWKDLRTQVSIIKYGMRPCIRLRKKLKIRQRKFLKYRNATN